MPGVRCHLVRLDDPLRSVHRLLGELLDASLARDIVCDRGLVLVFGLGLAL